MARRASVVAFFTLLSRILGYARDAVLAQAFGAGVALDAFVAAQTIPNVFRRLVAEGTLMIAFVPLLMEERASRGLEGARGFIAGVLGILLPVLLVLTLAGVGAPGIFVEIFASGFDEQRAELARTMTRIMMPYLFFVSLVAVAGGALNAFGTFGPPAAAPVFLNLAIIGAVLGFAAGMEAPILAAAWGVLAGGLLQLGLQVPFLVRRGIWVLPRWTPSDPAVRRLLARMLPAVFGVGVYQLNLVVIRQIASFLPEGQLSCYFIATRLEEFALGVFAVSISIAALPSLSEHAAQRDRSAFARTFRQAIQATHFVTIPSMVGLLTLTEPIVGTLFRYGAFTELDADLTVVLLRVMAFALVPIGVVRVLVPAYYAVGSTKLPVWAAFGSLATTTGLGILLGTRFEIVGLCVATAAASVVQSSILVLWFRRRVLSSLGTVPDGDDLSVWSIAIHAVRCGLATIPWVLVTRLGVDLLDWYRADAHLRFGGLLALVAVVAALYPLAAGTLGVPEVQAVIHALRRRIR